MHHVHVLGMARQSCFCCQTHVDWWSFYWFSKLKRQPRSKRQIRGEQQRQIAPRFRARISEDYLLVGMLLCVKTTSGSKRRNAGPVSSQVAVNSRWKANSWICSVISGLRLPPDSWNVRDDKRRPRRPHPAQHARAHTHTHTHTNTHTHTHTHCGMQRNEHVQEDNKPCLLLFLRIYVLKQQNTFCPNFPQITSSISPPTFVSISVMYYTLFSLKGVSVREKDTSISWRKVHDGGFTVYYSFGCWGWFPPEVKDEWNIPVKVSAVFKMITKIYNTQARIFVT